MNIHHLRIVVSLISCGRNSASVLMVVVIITTTFRFLDQLAAEKIMRSKAFTVLLGFGAWSGVLGPPEMTNFEIQMHLMALRVG